METTDNGKVDLLSLMGITPEDRVRIDAEIRAERIANETPVQRKQRERWEMGRI